MKERERERLGVRLKDFILGFQDGIVSSLGLVLGVAVATLNSSVVIISGISGALAEFISMAAVAYTSTEAAEAFYKTEADHKKWKIPKEYKSPFESSLLVGFSDLAGSAIAIIPFLILKLNTAIVVSIILSALFLFLTGVIETKLTTGNWIKSGLKLTIIGLIAAFAGYLIGRILGAIV